MTQTLITGTIGALTVVGAYFAARLNRPKIEAEAKQIMGQTYSDLIEQLRAEVTKNREHIDKLRTDLDYERKRNYALEQWSKALTAQVIELGKVPVMYSDFKGT